ncbi:Polyadenylate-binding protein-interacting protein 5 [Linum perenne]
MKRGTSSLNPYAASYVPIYKREVGEHTQAPRLVAKALQSGDHNFLYGLEHASESQQHEYYSSFTATSTVKSHYGQGFYGSSSQSSDVKIDKQMMDEESDMDLEFLQMSFPSVSSESLLDVYDANNGDLENTIEMLNELEFDIPENLPETLDIGDVPECGSSLKQKKVFGEGSSGTSFGSST